MVENILYQKNEMDLQVCQRQDGKVPVVRCSSVFNILASFHVFLALKTVSYIQEKLLKLLMVLKLLKQFLYVFLTSIQLLSLNLFFNNFLEHLDT